MRARFLLTMTTLLLIASLVVPTAMAQPKPTINVNVKWEVEHDMILPETGRGDMGVIVEVTGVDFVCAQPAKYKVEVVIVDPFAKWAGASMVPGLVPTSPSATFEFETGKPGTTLTKAKNSDNTDGNLNLAWDLETAPKMNAVQEYRVRGNLKTVEAGSCAPTGINVVNPPSTAMVVRLPDRPDNPNATANEAVCAENPFAPGCPGATATNQAPGGDAPGLDVAVITLALVGLVGLRRRLQN